MKKLGVSLLILVFVFVTFSGCSTNKPVEESKLKIGLSTDEGGLNDKSFNQAANTGIVKAQNEFKLTYTPIESAKKEDYTPNLQSLVDDGCGLVFGVGFQMGDAMTSVSKNNPDNKFAIIDSVVSNSNVESIVFKEQEGSFLVGVIAGKMTKTGKIGFIGGKDFDLINRFESGFAAGVKSVNPAAAVDLLNRKNVIYVDSFADTNKGYEAGKGLYSRGCDIIYHAAGGVGIGLFQAADELKAKGSNVWAIGVDMDQAVSLPRYKNVILTSMIKRVDVGTYTVVKDVVNNAFKGGSVLNLGLSEDGVGVAPSSKDNVPKDVLDLVDKYKNLVITKKIVVPTNRKEADAYKPPTV